ncbi:MAG: tetraacyldisaccharide 4'-kinase [Deltaproteobacteria bacterium]|nr:MAG: tetraacyldisaccharide 4'-kinase [Deltaproteobacteria bacterium]
MNHARLFDIMSGKATDPAASITRIGLAALEPGYRLAVSLRNRRFDHGRRTPARLPRPVISVGNLTTGGTGKTPMVIELARRLLAMNHHPAVLMRGYMADHPTADSDEAEELSRELGPEVPVMPNPDRVKGARQVLEEHPQVTVFLLDDGFQHRQVHRDLDIVLIDATCPFGFDHLLPRGLLREPVTGLRRADMVIVTRCDLVTPDDLATIDRQIEAVTGRPPADHTISLWTGFRDPYDHDLPADHLNNKQVVAASAIGNPAAFERMLESAAGRVLHAHRYDDHHAYTQQEIKHILADAERHQADAVVVTEKDWVKWRRILNEEVTPDLDRVPVIRPKLGVRLMRGGQMLNNMIDKAVSPDVPAVDVNRLP